METIKGLWVEVDILKLNTINSNEKLIFSEIVQLSRKKECYASNDYFAKILGISKRTVIRSIMNLEKLNFIKCKRKLKERFMSVNLSPISNNKSDNNVILSDKVSNNECQNGNKEYNKKIEENNKTYTDKIKKEIRDKLKFNSLIK